MSNLEFGFGFGFRFGFSFTSGEGTSSISGNTKRPAPPPLPQPPPAARGTVGLGAGGLGASAAASCCCFGSKLFLSRLSKGLLESPIPGGALQPTDILGKPRSVTLPWLLPGGDGPPSPKSTSNGEVSSFGSQNSKNSFSGGIARNIQSIHGKFVNLQN